jgi:proteasome lid subunit RPN8/RPN11
MTSLDIRSIETKELRERPCPALQHELRVILAEDAFDRAVERGTADLSREIGGVLVGELLRDRSGPYLQISATIDALHAEEKGAELTFTHATWEHIHKEMDGKHQGQKVVGWYHTHPGFGVFLSDRDQFIHKSFFDLPFQVAFVYDPKSREHGMFGWKSGEAARMRRFWIGTREQTWDGDRSSADARGRADNGAAASPSAARAAEPAGAQPAPALTEEAGITLPLLAFAAVLCLLLGGFGGHWLGAGSAQRALAEAQLDTLKVRAEATSAAVSSLQGDLITMVREALNAEAIVRPLDRTVTALDEITAALRDISRAAAPRPANPGAPPRGLAAAMGLPLRAPTPAPDSPLELQLARLTELRAQLSQLAAQRFAAHDTLRAVERAAGRQQNHALENQRSAELARDVALQRAGLGALYAELGAEAGNAKDLAKAKRYFATAAQLDPGNRARYQTQLQTFDKSARLPAERVIRTPGARP